MKKNDNVLKKILTGIEGFDEISFGGLPAGRATLVTGTSGSAKTIFAAQFLANGIKKDGESAVFVTFEESAEDIRENLIGLGWDVRKWEEDGMWKFVDASPDPSDQALVSGTYDLGALIARIKFAVDTIKAKRVSVDSIGSLFNRFSEPNIIRGELFKVKASLRAMDVTAIITAERIDEYGAITRFGVEEFVSDNVIILRNVLELEKRTRTIEILKFRGTMHKHGEIPFTIIPNEGIVVIPLSSIKLEQKSSNVRITSGNKKLDEMCYGGFFKDSIVLVSGATGVGKTLLSTTFLAGNTNKKEKSLLFAFEESHDQIVRNAQNWGFDFEKMENEGKLKILASYPENASLEDHLIWMKAEMESFKPTRIVVDSISALEHISGNKDFREFVIGLVAFMKDQEATGMLTSTTQSFVGGAAITGSHMSTMIDSIILLRYVEIYGEIRRCITVLKMRGSNHDKSIKEYEIDDNGYHIRKSFSNINGILIGNVTEAHQK